LHRNGKSAPLAGRKRSQWCHKDEEVGRFRPSSRVRPATFSFSSFLRASWWPLWNVYSASIFIREITNDCSIKSAEGGADWDKFNFKHGAHVGPGHYAVCSPVFGPDPAKRVRKMDVYYFFAPLCPEREPCIRSFCASMVHNLRLNPPQRDFLDLKLQE